jgi:glutathione S-transferase
VAIMLHAYGIAFEQKAISGFGETLVDSAAIIDHLNEIHGRDRALAPRSGAETTAWRR